ncbi:MAG: hypothetical protein U0805_10095 [Pirellulales bacterium]
MVMYRFRCRRVKDAAFSIFCFVFILIPIGCAAADAPGEFRESKGHVAKYSVEQTDPVLRIACFVRLTSGEIIHPKLYYFQMHYTAVGVRSVEKVGRIWKTTGRDARTAFLYLPTSEDIDTYLLLVGKVKGTEKDISVVTKWIWSDWQLLTIKGDDLSHQKLIVIPAFEQLQQNPLAKADQELLANLVEMYKKIEAAAIEKMNTPVGPHSNVPWYAR